MDLDELNMTIIDNMIKTLDYCKTLDLDKLVINKDLYIKLNSLLAKNQALNVGAFRDRIFYIDCIDNPIEIPNIESIDLILSKLNEVNKDNFKEVIATSFPRLARIQPFWDGNKRTALVICNLALLKNNLGILTIPNNKYNDFTEHLKNYCVNGDLFIHKYIQKELI